MNKILQTQNEPPQLDRLAAQRELYAKAKCIFAIQIVFSVAVGVALAFLSAKYLGWKVWGASWGFWITLIDLFYLTPWQKSLKKSAATIQEMFDCDVLELPPKRGRETVAPDDVAELARCHERRIGREQFDKDFRGWYEGALDTVPLAQARIICQRSNFRWDVALRQRYRIAVALVLAVVVVGVFGYGMTQNIRLRDWIATLVLPLQPLIILCIRQIQEQSEAIATLNRLKRDTEKLWNEALHGTSADTLTDRSRDIQDELFDQRAKNPLIFDWIYDRLKRSSEEEMNIGAATFIAQAHQAVHANHEQNT